MDAGSQTVVWRSADEASGRFRWWLWPNLLCLDAPLVTVVWQRFLSSAYGVHTPAAASACLGLVVWGVYLFDHWCDTRPGRPAESTLRHQVARDYHIVFGLAGVVVLGLAVATAVTELPVTYLYLGGALGLVVAVYLLVVHLVSPVRFLHTGGKELSVGVVTALGVALPLRVENVGRIGEWGPAVAAFGGLCWLNCRLIAFWERQPGTDGSPRSLLLPATWTAILSCFSHSTVAFALLGAMVLLGCLHLTRQRFGLSALRVLADAALLTPLPFWCLT